MKSMLKNDTVNILQKLKADPELYRFVDFTLAIPSNFVGKGKIKLIVLGQDPTVKNYKSRQSINMVLNLDKKGSLANYLNTICSKLGINLSENIFATNLLKNFFIQPPAQLKNYGVIEKSSKYWIDLLQKEISTYPKVPIITLGEPMLNSLILDEYSKKVRDYWGYTKNWKIGANNPFNYISPDQNNLERCIFPFPHQPSANKVFYGERIDNYISYVRSKI